MPYLSESSYWVYIVHIPIVFYVQAYLASFDLPIVLEIFLSFVSVLGTCLLLYSVFVRHTPIAWLFSGKIKRK